MAASMSGFFIPAHTSSTVSAESIVAATVTFSVKVA